MSKTIKVVTGEIYFQTQGDTDVINITDEVAERLKKTGFNEGVVFVFAVGSTAAISTCEYEPGLIKDLEDFYERVIPKKAGYAHDEAWGDGNGFSHLRSSLLGPTLAVPFSKGRLMLGTWQQIIFIDFDNRPRSRKVVVQFQGA